MCNVSERYLDSYSEALSFSFSICIIVCCPAHAHTAHSNGKDRKRERITLILANQVIEEPPLEYKI